MATSTRKSLFSLLLVFLTTRAQSVSVKGVEAMAADVVVRGVFIEQNGRDGAESAVTFFFFFFVFFFVVFFVASWRCVMWGSTVFVV